MNYIIDIETSSLLEDALNYEKTPYKLKEDFKIYCVVFRHFESGKYKALYGKDLTKENIELVLKKCTNLIGHNIVNYDLPVLKLYGLLDYEINYPDSSSTATIFDKECNITDTMIWSKLLNADRLGGHSLKSWGKRLGVYKSNFSDWSKFSEEMLKYCIQDTAVNVSVYKELLKEKANHNWDCSYKMEVKLVDLTLKQSLFGFSFDRSLADKNIKELTSLMEDISLKVNPILPRKKLNKTSSALYCPPKRKYKKNGEMYPAFEKFLNRLGATCDRKDIIWRELKFPVTTDKPLLEEEKATVKDIDVVKSYLLTLGWEPTEIKDRDITKNTDKTLKSVDDIKKSILRYVKQTKNSVFKDMRLKHLNVTEDKLEDRLFQMLEETKPQIKFNKKQNQKPIFLPTTPKLTVGLEKEICPNLVKLGEKTSFVADIVKYYTYRHRKNSIAGGTVDEDGEPITGFISCVRKDNRIPTPADTLGTNTGRYRHKIVCNIPRVTSLYGENMRSMFGCGKGLYQLGYDFSSLEARVMGHYVLPYKDGEFLAKALVAEKPNDIHTINGLKLGIDRSLAKSFSYAAIYGAQPKKISKMLCVSEEEGKRLFNEYWEAVPALKELKNDIEKQWEKYDKKYIEGLDGRLLSTRAKHSLINVLFQSAGAISAKWSAVYLAEYLESINLLGDPLKHAIDEEKVWFMIHMHDEQQLAVHPNLMRIKAFKSKEEAEDFCNRNKRCSLIGEGKNCFYVALETKPAEAIGFSIKKACKKLKLNVELGYEWVTGLNWGQCH